MSDTLTPDQGAWAAPVYRFGAHAVELEDDLVIARFRGVLTVAEAQVFTAHVDAITAARGPVYTVLDMRQALGPEPQAREWIGQWGKHAQIHASAVFGANTVLRVVLTLLSNATRLLFRRSPPLGFCADELEARAWVVEQRNKFSRPA